jgi:8-oxo-(d)GTP phosphatase
MSQTLKAGTIIIRKGKEGPEILLIYRALRKDWSFPKGHWEEGETYEETAIREAQEETGLTVKLLNPLPDWEYQNEQGDMLVKMFLAAPSDETQKERPQYKDDEAIWVPVTQIEQILSYQDLKQYFRKILEITFKSSVLF